MARRLTGIFGRRLLATAVYLCILAWSPGFAEQGATFIAHVATEPTREAALASYERIRKLVSAETLKSAEPFIHEVSDGPNRIYRLRLGPLMSRSSAANLCAAIIAAGHKHCVAQDAFVVAGVVPGFYGDLLLKPLKDGRDMQVA